MIILNSNGNWELPHYPLIPDESIILDWGKFYSEEMNNLPKAIILKNSFMEFLSVLADPVKSGRTFAPTSLRREFESCKTIARWMAREGVWRISELKFYHVIDFLKSRKSLVENSRPAQRTLDSWVVKFQRMWDLRNHYQDALMFDVGRFGDEINLQVRGRSVEKWKALPDHVAFALIADGLDWIEKFSDYQVEYLVDYVEYRRQKALLPKSKKKLSELFFNKVRSDERFKQLAAAINYRESTSNLMIRAMAILEGACLSLLLLLVGMRVSEVLALNRDTLKSEEMNNGFWYLSGPAAKKGGISRLWVIGNQLIHVVKLLVKIGDISRNNGSSALFLNRHAAGSIYVPGKKSVRMSRSQVVLRLHDFAISGLRKKSVKAEKFHPHMARKTFAQLAVRRDRSLLEPVSAHLGHVYQSFTDGHYVGIDHSLAQLLSEANRRELSSSLEHLLSCGTVVGGGAAGLETLRQDLKFKGKRALNSVVKKLIEKGVKIAPCDWGYCMYSEAYSACDGDSIGPNEVKRSPDVCAGCKNFAVTEKHRHWWEERVNREEKFLSQENLPEQTVALVRRRLARSENVLKNLVWLQAPINKIEAV